MRMERPLNQVRLHGETHPSIFSPKGRPFVDGPFGFHGFMPFHGKGGGLARETASLPAGFNPAGYSD